MTSTALFAQPVAWAEQLRDRLDSYGRKAWIAAMLAGFIFVWPVGLALALYMTATHRWKDNDMFGKSRFGKSSVLPAGFGAMRSSGNAAFDAYKADTLRRLEDEQQAFEAFLKRLRDAKDKQEFDAFMEDRAARLRDTPAIES